MNFLDHTLPEISKGYLDLLALLSVKLAEQNRLLEKNQIQNENILNRMTVLENNFEAAQQNLLALTKNHSTVPPHVQKNTTKLLQPGQILKDDGLELVFIPSGSFIMGSND